MVNPIKLCSCGRVMFETRRGALRCEHCDTPCARGTAGGCPNCLRLMKDLRR